jgi:hypothetical protein
MRPPGLPCALVVSRGRMMEQSSGERRREDVDARRESGRLAPRAMD